MVASLHRRQRHTHGLSDSQRLCRCLQPLGAYQDEDYYLEPVIFRTRRHVKNPHLPLVPAAAFGYGRRACPGQHLGMIIPETMIASLLWAFDFQTELG